MDNPIDGSLRRRIHLLRHAEAAYRLSGGEPASDPRAVPLTPRGRDEAEQMRGLLADVPFDFALCSGLPRTRETAALVLTGRELALAIEPALEEVEAGRGPDLTPQQLAHPFADAGAPGARFLGGELLEAFRARVIGALERQLATARWRRALFVCHGAVNRVILGWALGSEFAAWSVLEQDSCCLNVLDIDVDPASGKWLRRLVRAVNVTPYDLAKRDIQLTTLEQTAIAVARRNPSRRRNP
jgi:broad specificity phosphatase PhoE